MFRSKSFVSTCALLIGLSLASLSGCCSGLSAVEPSQPAQFGVALSVQTVSDDFEYDDDGPFDYLTDAIAVRDQYRAEGHGANVITGSDGAYWVRVFYR